MHIYEHTWSITVFIQSDSSKLKEISSAPLLHSNKYIEKVNNYEESQSTVKTMFSHTHPKFFASSVNKYSAVYSNYLPV